MNAYEQERALIESQRRRQQHHEQRVAMAELFGISPFIIIGIIAFIVGINA